MQKLLSAVKYVRSQDLTLLTSVDTPNWEMITAAAILNKVDFELILLSLSSKYREEVRSKIADEFQVELPDNRVQWIQADNATKFSEQDYKSRDQKIVDQAEVLIPISIRPGGHMSCLINDAKNTKKKILEDFKVDYKKTNDKLSYTIDGNKLSKCINSIEDRFVIHWTRGTNSNWPTEIKIDFYNSIFTSEQYPRSAFLTLQNIIRAGIIKSSSRNMPEKTATVSLSGLSPVAGAELMKWRARFRQMSFEPYGIGIEKEFAYEVGICPVHYYDPKVEKLSPNIDSWLTQSIGRVTDWRHENEFRCKGDLNLNSIPKEKLIAITHKKFEAEYISNESNIESVWFVD